MHGVIVTVIVVVMTHDSVGDDAAVSEVDDQHQSSGRDTDAGGTVQLAEAIALLPPHAHTHPLLRERLKQQIHHSTTTLLF